MLRHMFMAAWRNMAANRLQSAIAIGGLSIGLVAAILASIITIAAFSHNHFVPGHERLYVPISEYRDVHGVQYYLNSPHDLAGYLKQFPEIDGVARVDGGPMIVGSGENKIRQMVDYVDPDFFRLYDVPALHGDVATALDRPDGAVIDQSTARKFYGRENVIGQTLLINHTNPVTIRAVIADAPKNMATFPVGLFVSSLASFSSQTFNIGKMGITRQGGWRSTMFLTLVRLKPGASLDALNRRAAAMTAATVPKNLPYSRSMHFERLDELSVSSAVNPAVKPRLMVMAAVMTVILLLSCVNFINLSIARSVQRGLDVAIRKASGATRIALMVQFLTESVLQVLFALVLATAFVEWSLPAVNAFLNTGVTFDYWHDPLLLLGMITGAVLIGIFAGAYPGIVLSGFRPATVLKGVMRGSTGGNRLRQIMVGFQFAAMVIFLISAWVISQQNIFTTTQARRVPTDQTLLIRMPKCSEVLAERIKVLPNVRGVACSSVALLPEWSSTNAARPSNGGALIRLSIKHVGYRFFELYDLKSLAGRFFLAGNGDTIDEAANDQIFHYVIDENAVRQLGFANAQAAIGKPVNFTDNTMRGTIIGVVKNFSLVPPTTPEIYGRIFAVGNPEKANIPAPPELLHVKLGGQNLPETVAAIDAVWKSSGERDPINRQFLDDYIQEHDLATLRIGQAFAVFAGVAMLLACLGLFGISLFTATCRTKEIGVRKAMGASTPDIIRLLLWQFAKPVLWANFVAWPLAFYFLNYWLNGFVFHVALDWRVFVGATLATLGIALLTVVVQSVIVARAVPATALRYE